MEIKANKLERNVIKRRYKLEWGFGLKENVITDSLILDLKENNSKRRLIVDNYVIDVDTLEVLSSVYPPSYVLYDLSKVLKEQEINRDLFLYNLEKGSLGYLTMKEVLENSKESGSLLHKALKGKKSSNSVDSLIKEIDLDAKLYFMELIYKNIGLNSMIDSNYRDIIVLHQISILLNKEEFFKAVLNRPTLYKKLLQEFDIKFTLQLKGNSDLRIEIYKKDMKGV